MMCLSCNSNCFSVNKNFYFVSAHNIICEPQLLKIEDSFLLKLAPPCMLYVRSTFKVNFGVCHRNICSIIEQISIKKIFQKRHVMGIIQYVSSGSKFFHANSKAILESKYTL